MYTQIPSISFQNWFAPLRLAIFYFHLNRPLNHLLKYRIHLQRSRVDWYTSSLLHILPEGHHDAFD